ncbi:MAG TPA: hypothetical protein VFN74_25350, partial [Chloroflexota bacterium]|nr:hypothetical protein [Chloroflexota bacterium]
MTSWTPGATSRRGGRRREQHRPPSRVHPCDTRPTDAPESCHLTGQQTDDTGQPWRWPATVHPILVVEDDEALRRVLVEALEAAGHPVVSAANGA